jgi:alkylation response protein AidB-like acyl-CoA dehydrogenase
MLSHLSPAQAAAANDYRAFADRVLAPRADDLDARQDFPRELAKELGAQGWLSTLLPPEHGGQDLDWVRYGLMAEEIGRTCGNVRNFVAVQDMVSHSIWWWGDDAARATWLRRLATGEAIGSFCLTEPDIGSDARNVGTVAVADGTDVVINGVKRWISFGQLADVFLVFTQFDGAHTGFLVERDNPGVTVAPIDGLLGLRGSMLAEITFTDCRVPASAMIGKPGSGLAFVASSALEIGRYSTAWGCVGLAQACVDGASAYASRRVQFGTQIVEHQLVQRMLADMTVETRAARLLCFEAGTAKDRRLDAVQDVLVAKYYASAAAMRAATDAVQICGASGIGAGTGLARHFRDAKVMEIIEGTTQLLQSMLGRQTRAGR